eukprot:300775_1
MDGGTRKKSFRKVPLNRLQRTSVVDSNSYKKSASTGRIHRSLHRNRIRNRKTRHNAASNGTNSETEALLSNDSLKEPQNSHILRGGSQSQMQLYQETQYNEQR